MSRRCSICTHPEADQIDRALALGQSNVMDLARQYGVKHFTLRRHFKEHLTDRIKVELARQALRRRDPDKGIKTAVEETEGWMDRLKRMADIEIDKVLADPTYEPNLSGFSSLARSALGHVELKAKITGELNPGKGQGDGGGPRVQIIIPQMIPPGSKPLHIQAGRALGPGDEEQERRYGGGGIQVIDMGTEEEGED